MLHNQNNNLQSTENRLPIYLGGIYALLFAANALVCLRGDDSKSTTVTQTATVTFALASVFLTGITAINLYKAGKGSVMSGLKNSFFKCPSKNNLATIAMAQLPSVESGISKIVR